MIKDYETFITHLRRTGRLKLLPQVLQELRRAEARGRKLAPYKETAHENVSLISGWREIKEGMLTDHSAKGALVEIYRNITT